MAAVVYNACFGGFSLSRAAVLRGREISGNPDWANASLEYGHIEGIKRHDPVLVQVVRELGKEASGPCADLRVAEIAGTLYRITEYDGFESVETPDTLDWESV